MRVALAQTPSEWGDVQVNLERMTRHAEAALNAGAELVAFPELTVSGICKDRRILGMAEDLSGSSVSRLRRLARELGIGISFGFTEKSSGLPFNAYCLLEPDGTVAGVYRKSFIPKLEVPFWQGCRRRPVFSYMGMRLAVAICWDCNHEELLASYGGQGADCVLMPHAWDSDVLDVGGQVIDYDSMEEIEALQRGGRVSRWKSHDEMLEYFLSYIPNPARKFGFWGLFVNQSGRPHPCVQFVGPSFAVDPLGEVAACTREGSEQLLLMDLPIPKSTGRKG